MNTTTMFDYLDSFILTNTLTVPQLRHEITHARKLLIASNDVLSTPCCLLWSFWYDHLSLDERLAIFQEFYCFDWDGYLRICQEAVETIQEQAKRQPLPALPGNHIDIAGIKSRSDIVNVIEGYTQLRKSGHNRFVGRCPLHDSKHLPLTVYADSQSWYCFHCTKGGDIFDFVMAVEGVDFKQAAAVLGGT